MAYYAIGIGGTGAKCVEALVHLCAAGLMPDKDRSTSKKLNILFVDPDKGNGTLDRAQRTLNHYKKCLELELGSIDLFKTPIEVADPDVWSPFGEEIQPKFEDFFSYNVLRTSGPTVADLFDVLFSPEEKQTELDKGFRGRPSIGAAILANTIDMKNDGTWKRLIDEIALDVKNGQEAKIVLFGSIFGGTGASGVPTVARRIYQELEEKGVGKVQFCAVTMLPYFSFERKEDQEMRAQAEDFLINTQAALKYYAQPEYLDVFDNLYVLGDHVLSKLGLPLEGTERDSKGGKDQVNEPHFLEIYAALGAINFFNTKDPKPVLMIAREKAGGQTWSEVPYFTSRVQLLARLEQLIRLAFAYECTYYPALNHLAREGRAYRAPWYVNFIQKEKIQPDTALTKELSKVHEYCRDFLNWAASVQSSAKEVELKLFNRNAFSKKIREDEKEKDNLKEPWEFFHAEFSNLMYSPKVEKKNSLSDLWERLCDAKVRDKDALGVGKLIQALYTECRSDHDLSIQAKGKEKTDG